jgi:hypothetical protein
MLANVLIESYTLWGLLLMGAVLLSLGCLLFAAHLFGEVSHVDRDNRGQSR